MIVLRPYQHEIVEEARSHFSKGRKSALIVAPTGSGKTALTAHMLRTAWQKGMSSWFICHRRELIQQCMRAFENEGLPHGVISSKYPEETLKPVQICSIQTLARRYTRFREPQLMVWDEAHHCAAGSWAKIYSAYPKAFHIGLTATPERLDGQGLGLWFRDLVMGPSVSALIEQKYLVPYRIYAPPSPKIEGVRVKMGDYVKSDLTKVFDKPKIIGDAVEHYKKYANGKRAVVFCITVEHSKHVVEEFRAAGIVAEHVDGETKPRDRDAAIRRFQSGETMVLSNCELFGEGFDLPAIEAVIMLRPTMSLSIYLQQIGRSLRPSPGKNYAIILDHVQNWEKHGLPDDERNWSLIGRVGRKTNKDTGPSIKVCPQCFAIVKSEVPNCDYCGWVFETKPKEITQGEGELTELDVAEIRRRKRIEQKGAGSLEALIALGRQRGYRRPELWAKHILRARMQRKSHGG